MKPRWPIQLRTLLVVNVSDPDSAAFRCPRDFLFEAHANLSLGNLSWDEVGELASVMNDQPQQTWPHAVNATLTPPPPGYLSLAAAPAVDAEPLRVMEEQADWDHDPLLPSRIEQRRDFLRPPAWVVVLLGDNAKPAKARVAGPFHDFREAVLFEQAITDANNLGHTEIGQLELAFDESLFWDVGR